MEELVFLAKGTRKQFLCDGNKKQNMLQSPINVSTCPHIKFLCFATFFLIILLLKQKQKIKLI